MIEYEIDHTKTWSGLPAPLDWHIIDGIYPHGRPDKPRCGHVWERMVGHSLRVWEDTEIKPDGKLWLHISVSKRNKKMPQWEDLETVRKLFIGDRECYQIFPTEERYVNLGNVLHLWCCLSEPNGVLPHFE